MLVLVSDQVQKELKDAHLLLSLTSFFTDAAGVILVASGTAPSVT